MADGHVSSVEAATQRILLSEIKSLHESFDRQSLIFTEKIARLEVKADSVEGNTEHIAEIKSSIKPLFDNGHDGTCHIHSDRIGALEAWRLTSMGWVAGVSATVTLITAAIIWAFNQLRMKP